MIDTLKSIKRTIEDTLYYQEEGNRTTLHPFDNIELLLDDNLRVVLSHKLKKDYLIDIYFLKQNYTPFWIVMSRIAFKLFIQSFKYIF